MAGPMARHVGAIVEALGDLGDQTARVGARVAMSAQDIKSAVSELMGGGTVGVFAGAAAAAVEIASATLGTQMNDCADAANQASTASRICRDRMLAAAEQVDAAGGEPTALINIVTSLDVADTMMNGYIFNFEHLLAALADAILTEALPRWANETYDATIDCVRTLNGISASLVDGGPLGPPRYIPPTPVAPTPTPVPPTPAPGPPTASIGGTSGSIAAQLSSYLRWGRNPYTGRMSYDVLDEAALARDHPDWVPIVKATLAKSWNDNDVECVAFVYLVMALSNHNPNAITHIGNANTYWGAKDLQPPQWLQIPDGQGMPQPGDIMVMSDGGPGHVAIVTNVTPTSITFANGNASQTSFTFPIKDGKVISNWNGYTLDGFIRQTGS